VTCSGAATDDQKRASSWGWRHRPAGAESPLRRQRTTRQPRRDRQPPCAQAQETLEGHNLCGKEGGGGRGGDDQQRGSPHGAPGQPRTPRGSRIPAGSSGRCHAPTPRAHTRTRAPHTLPGCPAPLTGSGTRAPGGPPPCCRRSVTTPAHHSRARSRREWRRACTVARRTARHAAHPLRPPRRDRVAQRRG
jgi:hypothetical protein